MAGGFNLNALKNKAGAGAGLLNEKSQELASQNQFKIVNIPFEQIERNPDNGYHIDDEEVQELAQSIRVFGLKQSLDVLPLSDTSFRLITGEKRMTALESLRQDGDWGDTVPCTFTELEKINLPLDDKDKEFFALRETNYHQRKYTDADWLFEIERMETILEKLRAANIHEYEGMQIKGRKTREIIAEKIGMRLTQTGKYQRVNSKGTDELKQAVADQKINISIADKVASMEPEEQRELLSEVESSGKETIEANDVKEFRQKKDKRKVDASVKDEEIHTFVIEGIEYEDEAGQYTITKESLMEEVKSIYITSDSILLNKKQYVKYKDIVEKLKKLMAEK